jgi:hypothetical protein
MCHSGNRWVGVVHDTFRRAFWDLAASGNPALPLLTSEQWDDLMEGRQRARKETAHRARIRGLARSVEPNVSKARKGTRIALGVAGAMSTIGLGLSVPAIFQDTAAAQQHYRQASSIERTIASHLPSGEKVILASQLDHANRLDDSTLTAYQAGSVLSTVATEESTLKVGSWTAIRNAESEIAAGNTANTNSNEQDVFALAAIAGLIVIGDAAVALTLNRRRRWDV